MNQSELPTESNAEEMQCESDADQELYIGTPSSDEDLEFDNIVGALQEAVLQAEFVELQKTFFKYHCQIFENKEENRIEHHKCYTEYQKLIEKHILKTKINGFKMDRFSTLLQSRLEQIDDDLLEVLNSFTDFQAFKQTMLDHRYYYADEEGLRNLSIKGAVCRIP